MDYDALEKRLREPPFGTETSERNLMMAAADAIADLRARNDALVEKFAYIAKNWPDSFAASTARAAIAANKEK